jgi:hypothetical protein
LGEASEVRFSAGDYGLDLLVLRGSIGQSKMFRSEYIVGPRADWMWFLGFPFAAVAIALACHHWLPMTALASVGLWITIPHHFSTWLRTYGLREDWERWRWPLIVAPLIIMGTTALGVLFAPVTLLLLTLLWDHQHSLMQQHGLARIYDFRARTGGPTTGRFDLTLHWFLYGNMLITAPLFVRLWGPELYRWQAPVTPQFLVWIQNVSWGALIAFLTVYLVHVVRSVRCGGAVNPLKYLFVFSSYFLWYFTSWASDSLLVYGIAHRLMHGVQYMVIVNSYLGHKIDKSASVPGTRDSRTWTDCWRWAGRLLSSHRVLAFVGLGTVYVLLYQLILLRPLDELGFGVLQFMRIGPQFRPGMSDPSRAGAYDLFAMTLIQAIPMTHYYFDSFIWKVSDTRIQEGLE